MLDRINRAARFLSDCNVGVNAASASFFIVLSIFPLSALVLSLLRYLPVGPDDLLHILSNILPQPMLPLVKYLFNDLYSSNVVAIVSVSAAAAMWSASRGVYDLLNGFSRIMGGEDRRGYLRRRFTAVLYTVFLVLAVLLTLALQVFGQTLLSMTAHWDVRVYRVVSEVLRLRVLFTIALLALLFMLMYAFFPARHMALHDVIPGALAASVGWVAFSFLFSIYVNYGGGSRFYGSMAIALLSLLWLYFCMSILFYGAVLCRLSQQGQLSFRYVKNFLLGRE